MEIIEIIKETTKFSEGANKELSYIFIIPTIIMIIAAIKIINTYRRKTKQNTAYKYILTHHLALGCSLLITSAISGSYRKIPEKTRYFNAEMNQI